ncbi:metal-dependent transcriptional regulator [Stygiolobus caldivivus]|uniref:DtxR family iron (Metal) dependent repressor n=1 Tax=Stygiolobus caldivivus TaxID=2824673 RepID=A0A8D5U7C8_9CREN|nr:metal-dependent transcriptional regulator [Stygiolobus caldivivus]BCU70313.1 DtxR family iron (metal) dependent repressor [Stygiolobus caldivivus]
MNLSRRELSYLLVIKKYNDQGQLAKLSWVAKQLNISPASAYEELSHLEGKGFVKKNRSGIEITDEGKKAVDNLIKAHRVIESLLVEIGFSPDEACKYSTQFDFAVPEEIIDRLHKYLGEPKRCPHGEEIPITTS